MEGRARKSMVSLCASVVKKKTELPPRADFFQRHGGGLGDIFVGIRRSFSERGFASTGAKDGEQSAHFQSHYGMFTFK